MDGWRQVEKGMSSEKARKGTGENQEPILFIIPLDTAYLERKM